MSRGQDEMLTLTCEDSDGSRLRRTCQDLLMKNQFLDVTLSCSDGQAQAHRLVLCSMSSYMYELFTGNPTMTPCSHPMVILRDCKLNEVQLALQYMYSGRARTSRKKLTSLLNVAKELGCESLEGAVNRAIQSATTISDSPLTLTKGKLGNPSSVQGVGGSSGVNSLLFQITQAISIKSEPRDEDEELDKDGTPARKQSRSPSPTSSKNTIPPMPKLLRMTPASSTTVTRIGINNGVDDPSSPPILTRMNANSPTAVGRCPTPPSDVECHGLQLQHDKAESFVYTNENLNMTLFIGDEDEEDPNESDETEEFSMGQIKSEPIDEVGDEKQATCPWCNQMFTNVSQLQRHIKTHVGNTGSKPFTCPYCTHEFARSAHLKRHVRTHTGEKPYKCTFCDREFSRQDKMKTHITRHLQGTLPTNSTCNSNNSSLVRSSYPPVAMSQNAGGQVPIKILIPTNNQVITASTSKVTNDNGTSPSFVDADSFSPSTFLNDHRQAPSIMINAVPPREELTHLQPKRPTAHLNSAVN